VEIAAARTCADGAAVRGRSDWGAVETAHLWRLATLEATWIVETTGAVPAALALTVDRGAASQCWLVAHPSFTGRGLEAALLTKAERRARDAGLEKLQPGVFSEHTALRTLFERHGFREARHYYGMRIDLDRPPTRPSWPDGTEVSAFRQEDARAFYDALGESFEEEWGFHHPPFEDWKRTRLDAPETDTSLWFIVRASDEIAAVARCDPKREGGGWIGALGVRNPGESAALDSRSSSTHSSSSTGAEKRTSASASTRRIRPARHASTSGRACA